MAENVLRRKNDVEASLAHAGGRREVNLTGFASNHFAIKAVAVRSDLSISTLRGKLYTNDTMDGASYSANTLIAMFTLAVTEAEAGGGYCGYVRFDDPGLLYMDLDQTSELHVAWENEDAANTTAFEVDWLYSVLSGVRDLTPSTDTGPATA